MAKVESGVARSKSISRVRLVVQLGGLGSLIFFCRLVGGHMCV